MCDKNCVRVCFSISTRYLHTYNQMKTVHERWVIDWTINEWSECTLSRSERLKKQAYNTTDKTKTVIVVSVVMLMKDARVSYFFSSHFSSCSFPCTFEPLTKPNRCAFSSLLQLTHHNTFWLFSFVILVVSHLCERANEEEELLSRVEIVVAAMLWCKHHWHGDHSIQCVRPELS